MRRLSVRNRTRGRSLGDRIAVADRYWTRLRGFLGRPEPGEGEGLLIVPSRGVHMYGMRFPLDVILLDRRLRVAALYPELRPWSRTAVHLEAHLALELPAGTIEATGTEKGDALASMTASAHAERR